MPDIEIKMSTQDEDVRRSYDRLQKENIKLKRDLEKAGDAGERAGRKTAKGFDGAKDSGLQLTKQIVGITSGVELASAAAGKLKEAFQLVVEESRRLNQSIDENARKLDELSLKLQIQSGLTPQQVENKIPTIRKALLKTPSAGVADAFQIETQLSSSGFSKPDIDSGAALQTVLDLKAATNQFGETVDDPVGSVKAISQYLKATGRANPTAKDIRTTGGRLTQLFKDSDIQFPDLTNLAKVASGLTAAGLDESTQFGAFSILRDVEAPGEASTHLRNVVANLQSAGTNKVKTEALGKLGLAPGDVDLVGESFPEVLQRLNNRLGGLKAEDANNVLFQLFEKEGAASARVLLNNVDRLQTRISQQQSPDAFENNVEAFRNSRFARGQRDIIEEDLALRTRDIESGEVSFEELRQRNRTARAKGQIGPLGKVANDAVIGITEGLPGDFRPEDIGGVVRTGNAVAGSVARSAVPGSLGNIASDSVEVFSKLLISVDKMVNELKESNQTQKQSLAEQQTANRDQRGKVPRTPAAKALSRERRQ